MLSETFLLGLLQRELPTLTSYGSPGQQAANDQEGIEIQAKGP